ncbi:MAG: PEGA domain-containing protein [Deltaproteobacteria bacterium]|nr:PEGA domain-containing protein [Deltaproteobacteria bacterium]
MRYLCVVVLLVALFCTSTAFADARQHFMAGQDYYTQGRYKKAIEEFEEAYRLDPKSLLLYNIAQAYERLGDLPNTVKYLKLFIKADPENDDRETILKKIVNLATRIAATGIIVKVNEDGATVYIDGEDKGKTPIEGILPVDVGTHKVLISKDGFKDFKMSLAISSGHSVPVEAELEKGVAGPAPVRMEPASIEEEDDEGVEALDVVPWVIAGVGGAAAIVGLVVVGGMAAANDDHDQAVIADIIGWPGLALAAGGTIWGIVRITSKESKGGSDVAIVPMIDKNRSGVAAAFTF